VKSKIFLQRGLDSGIAQQPAGQINLPPTAAVRRGALESVTRSISSTFVYTRFD
jgi:hypothetical protein